jgi:hypothetical protein
MMTEKPMTPREVVTELRRHRDECCGYCYACAELDAQAILDADHKVREELIAKCERGLLHSGYLDDHENEDEALNACLAFLREGGGVMGDAKPMTPRQWVEDVYGLATYRIQIISHDEHPAAYKALELEIAQAEATLERDRKERKALASQLKEIRKVVIVKLPYMDAVRIGAQLNKCIDAVEKGME